MCSDLVPHNGCPTALLAFVLTQTSHVGLALLFHQCLQRNKHVQHTCLHKRLSWHQIACNVVELSTTDLRQLVCLGQPRQLSFRSAHVAATCCCSLACGFAFTIAHTFSVQGLNSGKMTASVMASPSGHRAVGSEGITLAALDR